MSDAETSRNVLPGLLRVAERAKRVPEARMLALAHHLDEELMTAAYRRIRKDAAVAEAAARAFAKVWLPTGAFPSRIRICAMAERARVSVSTATNATSPRISIPI